VTRYTLNDLAKGQQYVLKVRAVNSAGWSDWSATTPRPVALLSEDEVLLASQRIKEGGKKRNIMDDYKV
jgi:hypothetical protein